MPIVCSHTDGPQHDCAYTNARNHLIPEATQLAHDRLRARGISPDSGHFNREFFDAMDELAKRRGLVGGWVRGAMAA